MTTHIKFYLLMLACGICGFCQAQGPAWSVNPSGYEFSMTVTAVLNNEGAISADANDKVGAFITGACRGVASPSAFTTEDGHKIVFLQVYSNTIIGEKISFTFYDASEARLINAVNDITFQNDANIGTITSPYIITSNQDPTDITLSPAAIMEGLAAGSEVGIFSVTDADGGETSDNVYTLVPDSLDNVNFSIRHDTLTAAVVFDHTTKSSYVILAEVNDGKGGTFRKQFNIQITVDPNRFTANNYISPNGDGKNDIWRIKNFDVYKDYSITIYNDAGVTVFSTSTYNNDWNGTYEGKKLPGGVYYFIAQSPDKVRTFTGSISINR